MGRVFCSLGYLELVNGTNMDMKMNPFFSFFGDGVYLHGQFKFQMLYRLEGRLSSNGWGCYWDTTIGPTYRLRLRVNEG
jgi:hypothetical protein